MDRLHLASQHCTSSLDPASQSTQIDIIGIQMDFGASIRGVNMGPLAIRHAGLQAGLEQLGFDVKDKGDIIPSQSKETGEAQLKYCSQICGANKELHNEVAKTLQQKHLPLVLGGDHSISAGSISAARQIIGDIGVIWVDAHGDFNNEYSSPTGNMHGMPLSALCGMGPRVMVDFTHEIPYIDPQKVVLVGVRELDPPEKMRMKQAGLKVFTMSDIDRLGIATVMEQAIAAASAGTKGIYVSYDLDSISPPDAPGVGTPIPNGLTVREAFLIAESLAATGKIIGLDIVEVNPMLDICNKTGELACHLALALLGKTVY